jgi:hypothetical protein
MTEEVHGFLADINNALWWMAAGRLSQGAGAR